MRAVHIPLNYNALLRCNVPVLFTGFTAWSSTREPAQVFILLQTVYQAFDNIAKRRKVFKVETVSEYYSYYYCFRSKKQDVPHPFSITFDL